MLARATRLFRRPIHFAHLIMPAINNTQTQAYMQKASGLAGVYCVALNRPDAKNALSRQLLNDLEQAVASAASNPS